ncbi:MAG: hypothetical protein EOP84_26150 [Verrucomicrobiaceae bacterium]|nr:MAG: hypothetical protein EOP84_26150 [Verrucomicrobiaceae bacterium]
MKRLFDIGFSHLQKHRFPDARELLRAIENVDEVVTIAPSRLEMARQQLREQLDTEDARALSRAGDRMRDSGRALAERLTKLWYDEGLERAGQYPVFKDNRRTSVFYFIVRVEGDVEPSVIFEHLVQIIDDRFVVTWDIDRLGPREGYSGYLADLDGLHAAMLRSSEDIAAEVISALTAKMTPAG